MRRIGFLAVSLLFILATAHAQWTLEVSNTTADLRGIDSVGSGIAWASGSDGTVLRTEDGGSLWQKCAVPAGAEHLDFRGIQAFDADTAIVMSSGKGDLSRLYKTTDGCATWKLVFTDPEPDGFWDAIVMTDRRTGTLIGDPVRDQSSKSGATSKSAYVFPTYHTVDGGGTWSRDDGGLLSASLGNDGQPVESIFAASNSSMLLEPYMVLFVTGGTTNGLRSLQYVFGSASPSCKVPCRIMSGTPLALASGKNAGGFSLAADSHFHAQMRATKLPVLVAVGGDFTMPDSSTGTAAVCHPRMEDGIIQFTCEAAQTPPHGYRSAVAYDFASKIWITAGPNGTDVSTDNGRNWRAVYPDAALHEGADADRDWNALSLPFVVGPHGRIGKLDPAAIAANHGK